MSCMSFSIEELTPRQIVTELDRYIVGQAAAKRAVAVALRNRYRRQQVPANERDDILPKNILMIGPTGVGKTEIARRLAQLARAPFIKVEATKFTEVGYVGRDVESMIRELVAFGVRLVEKERMEEIQKAAEAAARERLVDLVADLHPLPEPEPTPQQQAEESLIERATEAIGGFFSHAWVTPQHSPEAIEEHRKKIREEIEQGVHNEELVEIELEEGGSQFLQVFTPQGMEEMGLDLGAINPSLGNRRSFRKVKVKDAYPILLEQESGRMIDSGTVPREAIERTEQSGIIFLDEIDKVAIKSSGSGPDVSREGVQRDLLPIIEGSTVQTKYGPVRTDHILFIAAGAFHMAKPSDLIPELQGRLPIRVQLENLEEGDFVRILREPQNSLIKQYVKLLGVDGVELSFEEGSLEEIAKVAWWINQNVENIGARRLHTMIEKLLEDILFEAPETEQKKFVVTAALVREKLGDIDAGGTPEAESL